MRTWTTFDERLDRARTLAARHRMAIKRFTRHRTRQCVRCGAALDGPSRWLCERHRGMALVYARYRRAVRTMRRLRTAA